MSNYNKKSIKKNQYGDNISSNNAANLKQQQAIDWFDDWRNSPRGKEMLRKSAGSEKEYERIRSSREKSLEELPDVKFLKEQGYHPNKLPKSGVYHDTGDLPEFIAGKRGISLYPYGLDSPTTMLHEVGHAEDRSGRFIPSSDKELINSYRPKSFEESPRGLSEEGRSMSKKEKQGESAFMKTYGNPKEVRELLNQLRFTESTMPGQIYDPFTEEVTPEIFQKMKNKVYETKDKNPLDILRKNFTDDQIMNMLNTISYNDNESLSNTNIAKKGKLITKKNKNNELPIAQTGKSINSFEEINNNPLVQAAKIFDPTGVTSYPDVYFSGRDLVNNPSWGNAFNFGINTVSALPIIGKVAVPLKLAKGSFKTINAANKTAETLSKIESYPVDWVIKNFEGMGSVIPSTVRKGTIGLNDLKSYLGNATTEQLNKILGNNTGRGFSNKKITKEEKINLIINGLNSLNTSSDIINTGQSAVKDMKAKYNSSIPKAQWGDLLDSGPLSDLFKSGQDWSKAWRGDIFGQNSLINKTIFQNQKGLTPEKMYGDPASPFYDPNYKSKMETATTAATSDYDQQYELWQQAQKDPNYDPREWTHVMYGPEQYTNTVLEGDANIAQYKPKSDAQKLQQTAQGVFSGLQYQAGYQRPEAMKLQQGFQGTQWAQYGKSVAERYNNPMNVMYTKTTKGYGAEDSGQRQSDGTLNFAKFNNPREGISAATQLLTKNYANKTIDETLKRYSNQGYDSKIIKSIPKNKKIKDLNSSELTAVLQAMGMNEMPREYYNELSSKDMFNPQYELNESVRKNIKLINNSVPRESTAMAININNLQKYQYGGSVLRAQYGSEVKTTVKDPMNALAALRKYNYFKDISNEQFMALPVEEQNEMITAAMMDFNKNNPRSSANTMAQGEVVEEIRTPLSASTMEVVPGQQTAPQLTEEEKFLMWYREQPEGTVQEYNGRKIKIDRGGGADRISIPSRSQTQTQGMSTPDKVVIKSGLAKDIYNKRYGGNLYHYQNGGSMNYTGYTPGTPTAMNRMNIIPGDTVTSMPTNGVPLSNPILTIANLGKKKDSTGTNHGLIGVLKPGETKQVVGANKIVELPMETTETDTARYGSSIYRKKEYGGNIIKDDLLYSTEVPKRQGGGSSNQQMSEEEYNNAWIDRIMRFEETQGNPRGKGMLNWGYNKITNNGYEYDEKNKRWVNKQTNETFERDDAIEAFKKEFLPKVSNLPRGVRERIGDYLYNTGRNPNQLLMLAAGIISLDDINDNTPELRSIKDKYGEDSSKYKNAIKEHGQRLNKLWNDNKSKVESQLSNPEFAGKLTSARDAVASTTRMIDGAENPSYKATWYDRARMFDPYKITYETRDLVKDQKTNPYMSTINDMNNPDNIARYESAVNSINSRNNNTATQPNTQPSQQTTTQQSPTQDISSLYTSPEKILAVNNNPQNVTPTNAIVNDVSSMNINSAWGSPLLPKSSRLPKGPEDFLTNAAYSINESNEAKDYLAALSSNAGVSSMYSTPEFNQRMLTTVPPSANVTDTSTATVGPGAKAAYESMMSNPDDTVGNISGFVPKKVSSKDVKEIYNLKGDNTYEYSKDENGNWITRRKGSNSDWNIISTSLDSEDRINTAIDKLNKNAVKVNSGKSSSGASKSSNKNITVNTDTNLNYYGETPNEVIDQISNAKQYWGSPGETTISDNPSSYYRDPNDPLFQGKIAPEKAQVVQYKPTSKKYGGNIKRYQYGGEINSDHTFPIHPITEEFTEIQTEKGETVFLPDGTIVDVKATQLHKNMDKDKVTDILPEGSYIFSNDKDMRFKLNDKIGGIKLEDMKVGKTAFEYKENEITAGPQDIYFKEMFGGKDNLTPADITRNIKKKFEVRDMKNDFFVSRANNENKSQRVEYLNILKTFSEFKKPKSKREVPKAQYGMNTSGLSSMYNQVSNNAIDGVMGYTDKVMDPMYRMDNNVKSQFNISSIKSPKLFEDGGSVPHAALGDLIKLNPGFWVGDYIVKQRAEKKADELRRERQSIWDKKEEDTKKAAAMNMLTQAGTYAAGLNVPDVKYSDYGTEYATTQDAYNRASAINKANTYAMSQGLGSAASLARYAGGMNPQMGSYLAQSDAANRAMIQQAGQQEANLELQKAQALNQYTTLGQSAADQAANQRAQQLYNVNVAGLGNLGRSGTDYLSSMGDLRFDRGMDKMTYDQYLEQRVKQARQNYENQVKGVYTGVLDAASMVMGVPGVMGGGGAKPSSSADGMYNVYGMDNALNFTNPANMSPVSARFASNDLPQFQLNNPSVSNTSNFNMNTAVPGATVNRFGTLFNPFNPR